MFIDVFYALLAAIDFFQFLKYGSGRFHVQYFSRSMSMVPFTWHFVDVHLGP